MDSDLLGVCVCVCIFLVFSALFHNARAHQRDKSFDGFAPTAEEGVYSTGVDTSPKQNAKN